MNRIVFDNEYTRAAEIRTAIMIEREQCAKLCKGALEVAKITGFGLSQKGAIAMAETCVKLIRENRK